MLTQARQQIGYNDLKEHDPLKDFVLRGQKLVSMFKVNAESFVYSPDIKEISHKLFGTNVLIIGNTAEYKTLNDAADYINSVEDATSSWLLLLLPQTHYLSYGAFFNVDGTVSIIGLNNNNTTVRNDTSSSMEVFSKKGGDILLYNFKVSGNALVSDTGLHLIGTGVVESNILIKDMIFLNCAYGIYTDASPTADRTGMRIISSKFLQILNEGISWRVSPFSYLYDSIVSNCLFTGVYGGSSTATGIKQYAYNSCNIHNCTFSNLQYGINSTTGFVNGCSFNSNDVAVHCPEYSGGTGVLAVATPLMQSNTIDIELAGSDASVYIIGGQVTASKISNPDGGTVAGYFVDPTTDSNVFLPTAPAPGPHGITHTDGTDDISLDGISIDTDAANAIEIKGFGAAANATVITKTAATGLLGYQANLIDAGYADSLHKHKNTNYTKVLTVAPTASEGDYTDIATALAAFTGLSSSARGLLLIQPGTYTISAGIAMVQYVDIVGVSRESVIITTTGSAIQPIITPASDSRLECLTVLGRYNTVQDYGVYKTSANDNFIMHNVRIKNCYVGFRNSSATKLEVTNCTLDECEYFFDLMGNSKDHFIDDVVLRRSAAYGTRGLYLNGTFTYSQLSNIKIIGALTTAVSISATTGIMLSNVAVWNSTTAFTSAGAADVVMLCNCAAYSCTTDLITNAAGGKLQLSGGYYTAAKITDAGLVGIPGSKGIRGTYYDLAANASTTR